MCCDNFTFLYVDIISNPLFKEDFIWFATNFHQFYTLGQCPYNISYVKVYLMKKYYFVILRNANFIFFSWTFLLICLLINISSGLQPTSINFPFWVSVLTICPKSVYKMKNNILSVCAVAILSFFYFDITTNSLFHKYFIRFATNFHQFYTLGQCPYNMS